MTIFGDGSQTRSFCYRDDLVEGMIRMMEAPDDVTGPINLGNPGEFTIQELAEMVLELTGGHREIIVQATAGRRPDPPTAGHHAGPRATRLVADGRAAEGLVERSTGSARRPQPLSPAHAELLRLRGFESLR